MIVTCQYCQSVFKNAFRLKLHIEKFHEIDPERYVCEECGEKFSLYSAKQYHFKKHLQIKYPCIQCGKDYSSQHNLQEHIDTKHEKISYVCENCSYEMSFNARYILYKFIRPTPLSAIGFSE